MAENAGKSDKDRAAEKFEQMFAEFRASQAPFLNKLRARLDGLPEKDLDLEDVIQCVKLQCWKAGLSDKKHPVAYIKACLRNFVNKRYKDRLEVFENLHYLDSIDDGELHVDRQLRSESTIERTMETAQDISFALARLEGDERLLIEKVYWEGADNSELYRYFREQRFAGRMPAGDEKVRFEAWVRQEKCRVTKKFRNLMRGK